jgi:hypothetical protein
MRLNRVFLLVFLVLLSASGFAQQHHDEWLRCENEDDCVITRSACGCGTVTDQAVNKDYQEEFDNWAAKTSFCTDPKRTVTPDANCQYAPLFGPHPRAKCVNGKCAITILGP